MVAIVTAQTTPDNASKNKAGDGKIATNSVHHRTSRPTASNRHSPVKMSASSAVRIRLLYHIMRRQAEQRAKRLEKNRPELLKPKPIKQVAHHEDGTLVSRASRPSSASSSRGTSKPGSPCDCPHCSTSERTQLSSLYRYPTSSSSSPLHLAHSPQQAAFYSHLTYYNAIILNSLRAYNLVKSRKDECRMWRPWQ